MNTTNNAENTLRGVSDALKAEAYISGRRAGLALLSPSLNEHPPGSPLYHEWLRGHASATAQRASEAAARRKVASPCLYIAAATCDCGGRGLCLDVA